MSQLQRLPWPTLKFGKLGWILRSHPNKSTGKNYLDPYRVLDFQMLLIKLRLGIMIYVVLNLIELFKRFYVIYQHLYAVTSREKILEG